MRLQLPFCHGIVSFATICQRVRALPCRPGQTLHEGRLAAAAGSCPPWCSTGVTFPRPRPANHAVPYCCSMFCKARESCRTPLKTRGGAAVRSSEVCFACRASLCPHAARGFPGGRRLAPGPPRAAAPRRHCATPPASQPAPFGSRQSGGRDGARRLPPRPLRARGIAPTAPRILPKSTDHAAVPWKRGGCCRAVL